MWQGEMTHRTTSGTARLDRAYVTPHIAEQQYSGWAATALDWNRDLSTHRPLEIARRSPREGDERRTTISLAPARRQEWAEQVNRRWHRLKHDDKEDTNVHRSLLLLKRSMQQISDEMFRKGEIGEATTSEDKVGAAIRALKGIEKGRRAAIERACKELPALKMELTMSGMLQGSAETIRKAKDLIVKLAKENVRDDLEQLSEDRKHLPEAQEVTRRKSIMQKIAKLKPGTGKQLSAIIGEDDKIRTNPAEIAAGLKAHWEPTFRKHNINDDTLNKWLEETVAEQDFQKLPNDRHIWEVKRKDVAWAVNTARNSAPGPDGLTASHWKAMGSLGVTLLHEVAKDMAEPDVKEKIRKAYWDENGGTNGFNVGILCCIPKGEGEQQEGYGRAFRAEQTRPLSLVDVSNRILASSYKRRWERTLGPWTSHDQRGFIKGRSMVANILELEAHGLTAAGKREHPMMVLVDFRAAFPSVSHDFTFRCLEAFGMPQFAVDVLRTLYLDGACRISVGVALLPGFPMGSGIRQGCPLSPLIFAVCMDLLLRRLRHGMSAGYEQRAFADDVGLILQDFSTDFPRLAAILQEFRQASCMTVNIKKTLGIPLWPWSPGEVAGMIAAVAPEWGDMPIRSEAVYLGCVIGPGKKGKEWDRAAAKFQERIAAWPWSALGLHFATLVYNVYAHSTLSFTAQLANPDAAMQATIEKGLRKAAPGPGTWATAADLTHLKQYGMPRSFAELDHTAKAAKLRVAVTENTMSGGLHLEDTMATIDNVGRSLNFPTRALWWKEWRDLAVVTVLWNNKNDLKAQGIDGPETLRNLTNAAPEKMTKDEAKAWAKQRLQKTLNEKLQAKDSYNAQERSRNKLNRRRENGIEDPPRVVGDRFCNNST